MQGIIFVIAILWVVFGAIVKKKQNDAQQAAARERARRQAALDAERQRAGAEQAKTRVAPQPIRPSVVLHDEPAPQTPRLSVPAEGDGRRIPAAQMRLRTEAEHVVRATSEGGHTHTESSITSVSAPCAPDAITHSVETAAHVGADRQTDSQTENPFVWDQNAVLSGLVMSEILGKPLALRE